MIKPSFAVNVEQGGKRVFWIELTIGSFGTDTINVGSAPSSLAPHHVYVKIDGEAYEIGIDL